MLQRQFNHRMRREISRQNDRVWPLPGHAGERPGHFIVAANRDGPDIKPQALGALLKLFKAHPREGIIGIVQDGYIAG